MKRGGTQIYISLAELAKLWHLTQPDVVWHDKICMIVVEKLNLGEITQRQWDHIRDEEKL